MFYLLRILSTSQSVDKVRTDTISDVELWMSIAILQLNPVLKSLSLAHVRNDTISEVELWNSVAIFQLNPVLKCQCAILLNWYKSFPWLLDYI